MTIEKKSRSEQEHFWAGEFGTDYINRNKGEEAVASNVAFFSRALRRCDKIDSVIELGANIGLNLAALKVLYPNQTQYAVEINRDAASVLRQTLPECNVFEQSILEIDTNQMRGKEVDLAFVRGVLIHINPDVLDEVYEKLYKLTRRYLLIGEYYNPSPVAIEYRGHKGKLFKRDFCGEILDKYPDLKLIDYGFIYHRDPVYPQDDITWFLLEKQA